MLATIAWGLVHLNRYFKSLGLAVMVAIAAANTSQVVHPTLRLYNMIPYEKISSDIVHWSQRYKLNQVLLSDNSLNTLSIQRYLQLGRDGQCLQVLRIDEDRLVANS